MAAPEEPLLEGEFGGPPGSGAAGGGPRYRLRLTRTELQILGGGPAEPPVLLEHVVGCHTLRTPALPRAAFFAVFAYPPRVGGSGGGGGSRRRRAPTFRADAAPDYEGNRETAERWARVIRCLARGETPPRNALPPEPRRRRLLLLLNPFGGRGRALRLCQSHVLPMICEAGISFNLVQTERPNHAKELVSGLSLEQWDGIVTVSGDGLVYEVVNGLLSRPDWALALRVPLGVLPCGSGNGLAAAVNCHAGLSPALGVSLLQNCSLLLCRGSAAPLDVLSVSLGSGPRLWSVLAVAWGLVAEADVGSERLRRLGPARFLLAAAARLLVLSARRARLAYLPALEGTERGVDRENGVDKDAQTRLDNGTDLLSLENTDNRMESADNGITGHAGTSRARLGTGTELLALENTDNGMENTDKGVENTDNRMENTDNGMENTDKGVENTDNGMENTDKGVENTDNRMENTDNGMENTDKGMENTDNRMENTDNGMENTDNRMENTDNGMENMDNGMENTDNGMGQDNEGLQDARTRLDTGTEPPALDNGMERDNRTNRDTGTRLDTRAEPDTGTQKDTGTEPDTGTRLDTGTEPETGTQKDTGTEHRKVGTPPAPRTHLPRSATSVTCSTAFGDPPGDPPGDPDLSRAVSDPGLCDGDGEGWGDPAGLGDAPDGGGDAPKLGGTPRRGPEDDLLVPLGQPLPPGWVTLEGDFVLVVALSPSHLGADLVAAPRARPDDGLLHLLFVRGGVSRGALLRALLAMARGGDPGGGPGTPLSRVPARAFRLEPLGAGGTMTVDGERVPCGPVQGQLHPGLARAIMALPPK